MIRAIQDCLFLYRNIEVTVPISLAIAHKNLHQGLLNDIVLSKQYQLTRYYWGSSDLNRVRFFGPKSRRQFCFHFYGKLSGNSHETKFAGTMRLRNLDFYQVACAALFLIVFLSTLMKWAAISPLTMFLGFLYSMTQWHLAFYQKEYQHLLTSLIKGDRPKLP
ncbi:hypothetical protein [[Leptolyngbya] sp. PCC 7376]|uniref:hypothetical protein n=1 Tax=[Leptolyngbya] sp. PCC 7376 TaxID=111781 RepID=UPI0003181ECC|nr:hypothetical protein [[Leptolyngbya] sp. PCC 7376]